MKITREQWQRVHWRDFERLSLAHVTELYPDVDWLLTDPSADGGRDGEGPRLDVETGLREIYWMEAKNHAEIDHYTLGAHFIAVVLEKNVKLLHAVGSGRFSSRFVLRARAFAADCGFRFNHTDGAALTAWLSRRRELLPAFREAADDVAQTLDALTSDDFGLGGTFASAFAVPDNDTFRSVTEPATDFYPGLKYSLVITFSRAWRLPPQAYPLTIEWRPDVHAINVITSEEEVRVATVNDIGECSVITVPFRVIAHSSEPLPDPVVRRADGEEPLVVRLSSTRIANRLSSPFVGEHARELLIRSKRKLRQNVKRGEPALFCFSGRAGSGKSRLAEEIRDDARSLAFETRLVRMQQSPGSQQELWCRLFRWIFGLENNLFGFEAGELIRHRLARLRGFVPTEEFTRELLEFLTQWTYSERLFDREHVIGRQMLDATDQILGSFIGPVLLHVDDAHHLTEATIAPLRFFRALIDTRDLCLAVMVTSRDDETVLQPMVRLFFAAVRTEDPSNAMVEVVSDFTRADAEKLVASVLRVPEVEAADSGVLRMFIERAGTNGFSLMQLLEHVVVEKSGDAEPVVTIGRAEQHYLRNLEELKRRLATIPAGIDSILRKRCEGLRQNFAGRELLAILATASLFGREAELRLVEAGVGRDVTASELDELLRLGYAADADSDKLVLSHDILAGHLRGTPEAAPVASRLVEAVDGGSITSIEPERFAAICYHAGRRYWPRSWEAAVATMTAADAREDHRGVLRVLGLVRALHHADRRKYAMTRDIAFMAAIADQQSGNARAALRQFIELIESAQTTIRDPASRRDLIICSIEAGNQCYGQLELERALRLIGNAIEQLAEPDQPFGHDERLHVLSLAHNRRGAVLQTARKSAEAEQDYRVALEHAERSADHYLMSHTLSDLAGLLRLRDPGEAKQLLKRARHVLDEWIPEKRRRRLMLDIADLFHECNESNRFTLRLKLYSIGVEAMQMDFASLASQALTCRAYCALEADEWREAEDALLKVLDITAITESRKSRLLAYHYLAVCRAALGDRLRALDYNDQAVALAVDPLFVDSDFAATLKLNAERIAAAQPPAWIVYDHV